MPSCVFCAIVDGAPAQVLYRDDTTIAFLDRTPLIVGHVLVTPLAHVETLDDLPDELLAPFLAMVRRISRAFPQALGADGSFVAVNTRISQSVPHLHAHVVPRRKGDGLFSPKGGPMVWMRRPYKDGEAEEIARKLRAAL